MKSKHASSIKRATQKEIVSQADTISVIAFLTDAFEAMPHIVWVLNRHRQIVFANRILLEYIVSNNIDDVYGLRPGEALDCVNAGETKGGCGATENCASCGATLAILSSLDGKPDSRECQIAKNSTGDVLNLRMHAAPLTVGDAHFAVVSAVDISHEKRRRSLERIFFHDILNVAGTVRFISELIGNAEPHEMSELGPMLYDSVDRMVEEIHAQKDLAAAENYELTVDHDQIDSLQFLNETVSLYRRHRVSGGRNIVVSPGAQSIDFVSDKTLLRRVISNMLKNALEASIDEGTIALGCELEDGQIRFWVHNPEFMQREIQIKMFKRSFSTKGADRGLGTYSMKLLTERYLGGEVSFVTSPGEGTTFSARYPLNNLL